MTSAQRNQSDVLDQLIGGFDRALKTLTGGRTAQRENPAKQIRDADLSVEEKRHVGGLMRVNHTGEICAQALYEGQALTAKDPAAQRSLIEAAAEEHDHLSWCAQRLEELDAKPSILDPFFYGASFALGAGAGLLGDRISLGFVEATEAQVVEHLNEHLESIPQEDEKTRVILQAMRADEARHGAHALEMGGEEFSSMVKRGMSIAAKIMTKSSYRI
ncbi:MAG: 2-polyprenyl-3-methyl-6-methoxy-1,4-benzoquinone monooxygenase [Candidatus Azotimanducaceae bacterium]|jgi:ubiquinone biosynthesis monooxygenase Coq7